MIPVRLRSRSERRLAWSVRTIALGVLGALGACGDTTPSATSVATRLILSITGGNVALNGQVAITASVLDQDNENITAATDLEWTSSEPAIATVSDAGVVAGLVLGGPVTITASVGALSATAVLRVTPAQIVIAGAPPTLPVGNSIQLSGTVVDGLGAPIPELSITWINDSPDVVTLDLETLVLVAIGSGNANIRASAGGQISGFSMLVGVVSPLDGVYLTPSGSYPDVRIEVQFGLIVDFKATVRPSATCSVAVAAKPNTLFEPDVFFEFPLAAGPLSRVRAVFSATTHVFNGNMLQVVGEPGCATVGSTAFAARP